MFEIIIRNSARCLDCGDEIESVHRHDFRCCSCGQVAVDGGREYTRRVFKSRDRWVDTTIYAEQPATEAEIAESMELLALANAGARPRPDVYADAPILHDWKIVQARADPAMFELEGIVYGHPDFRDFRDGDRIRTTPLLIRSEDKAWARTMNRYWRLGTPSKESLE